MYLFVHNLSINAYIIIISSSSSSSSSSSNNSSSSSSSIIMIMIIIIIIITIIIFFFSIYSYFFSYCFNYVLLIFHPNLHHVIWKMIIPISQIRGP